MRLRNAIRMLRHRPVAPARRYQGGDQAWQQWIVIPFDLALRNGESFAVTRTVQIT